MNKINYRNSLISLAGSLSKYLGGRNIAYTDSLVDIILETKPKHIAVVLLDGFGVNILNTHCSNGSILKVNKIKDIDSVYPPTTAAATTAFLTGMDPLSTGWLGWHLYLNETSPSTILFRNTDYKTDEPMNDYQVKDIIPTTNWFSKVRRGTADIIWPSCIGDKYPTFKDQIDALKTRFNEEDNTFTYVYYEKIDYNCHEFGIGSNEVKEEIKYVENVLNDLQETLTEDDFVFVIADHGLINVDNLFIDNYPNIKQYLRKDIAGEGRFIQFYLKDLNDSESFRNEFKKTFNDDFLLLSKDEYLNSGLSGFTTVHPSTKYSIGDFVGISVSNKYMNLLNDLDRVLTGHHAGLTKEEVKVPLILIRKKTYGKQK